MEKNLRQPIVTVAGHVDHGKTSILDKIRGTCIQQCEAGGITQKISFTTLPKECIERDCGELLKKFNIPLKIPGILFIDTPGHAAFSSLRKRGGALADIAIVVIDINDGIKPQTAEVLQILKVNKTPFIIALNKIDNISGWRTSQSLKSFDSLNSQAINVKQDFEEKYYTLVGALNSYGFNPELYFKIQDFTKNIAVVPCSARTGEGIHEIIAMITALSQKFLSDKIEISDTGKGVVLEVKKDNAANFLECILSDGTLSNRDEIAIASFEKVIRTKIRNIQKALPLNCGFKTIDNVEAAAGIKMQINEKDEIFSGMPFQVIHDDFEEIKEKFIKEISDTIRTDEEGICVKADSLGSLEALLILLRQKNISVINASIGPITKKDVYFANSLNEQDRAILGFNIELGDVEDLNEIKNVKILMNPVVYKLIEDFELWRDAKQKEMDRRKLSELPNICKVTVLDFVFRNSNPAVFGVVVDGGTLKKNLNFINSNDEKIGQIKEIQAEKHTVQEAAFKQEVAVSMPGINFERQLKVGESLFTNLGESQYRKFKEYKDLLTSDEKSVLKEIALIKRRTLNTWGI
jgi:translation initiation factor 5B